MDVRVQFVVDNKYRAALEEIARKHGEISMTDAFRRLILMESKRLDIELVDYEPEQEMNDGQLVA